MKLEPIISLNNNIFILITGIKRNLSLEKATAKCFNIDKYHRLQKTKKVLLTILCKTGGEEHKSARIISLERENSHQKVKMICKDVNKKPYAESNLTNTIRISSYNFDRGELKSKKALGKTATIPNIEQATGLIPIKIAELLKVNNGNKYKKHLSGIGDEDKSNGSKEESSTDNPSSCTPTSKPLAVNMTLSKRSEDTSFNAKAGSDNRYDSNIPETQTESSNTTDANCITDNGKAKCLEK